MAVRLRLHYLCIVLAALLMQGCTSSGILTEDHSDLSHIEDGLAIVTVRFQGPYVLKAITLRNLETGTRYGERFIQNPPRDIVGPTQQDRQLDLFIDMPAGTYVVEHIQAIHEAGFTSHTMWDGDFLFAEYETASPVYLGELYISIGDEVRRTGLISKASDVYFSTGSDHEIQIQRLRGRYKALAAAEIHKGRIWNE